MIDTKENAPSLTVRDDSPARIRIKFGDVARKVNNKIDPNTKLERYVAGEHMETDELHIRQWGTIGDDYLGPAFHNIFRSGQILYGSRRTYLRKVGIPNFDGICANTTFVIEPTGQHLLPELLPFIMQSEGFTNHSIRESKGSTNPYVNWKDLTKYEFDAPGKIEQEKIVKILLAVEQSLEKVNAYETAATELRDTTINNIFRKGAEKERVPGAPGKSINWVTVPLAKIAASSKYTLVGGPFGSNLVCSDYTDAGVPVIRGQNMVYGLWIKGQFVYVSTNKADSLIQNNAYPGDIVFTQRGTLGQVSIIPVQPHSRYVISQSQMKLTVNQEIADPVFIYYQFTSQKLQRYIAGHAVQTGVPHINLEILKKVPIVIPPLEEQKRIANRLIYIDSIIEAAQKSKESTLALKKQLINHYFPKAVLI